MSLLLVSLDRYGSISSSFLPYGVPVLPFMVLTSSGTKARGLGPKP